MRVEGIDDTELARIIQRLKHGGYLEEVWDGHTVSIEVEDDHDPFDECYDL